eukprot:TRINITY_DN950_c0_g1_i2.p1 TRINITY_DN950_c0_g1~~TRINITY_DN950_c0_g1_i2.p1  ORF type:complete len:146 (+),score=7.67 TRINITY_DN950_c0_g1_i2:211-648(+)
MFCEKYYKDDPTFVAIVRAKNEVPKNKMEDMFLHLVFFFVVGSCLPYLTQHYCKENLHKITIYSVGSAQGLFSFLSFRKLMDDTHVKYVNQNVDEAEQTALDKVLNRPFFSKLYVVLTHFMLLLKQSKFDKHLFLTAILVAKWYM